MTLPVVGPVSMSAFTHPWYWLFALVPVTVIALYIAMQFQKRRHVMRFANMAVLEQVAPRQSRRWRHLGAALLVVALLLFTVAMAGPAYAVRILRNRAVVMLVIDVSESMAAQDVVPNRLAAAKEAGKQFADELTPGINLGLISFAGTAAVLVSPTTNRAVTKAAIDKLQLADRTATGEGIYTALQAIASVGAVMGGGDGPPPARIVLESDGKETVPADPEAPRGAYPAARAAKQQDVPISTISFGTPDGYVMINGQQQSVPVDDETLRTITEITGGEAFHAGSLGELSRVYAQLQQQIGFETIHADASAAWLRMGVLVLAAAAFAGLVIRRPLPI